MIADVAFDAPVRHSFSYRIPDGWARLGQRARCFARRLHGSGWSAVATARIQPAARSGWSTPSLVLSKAQLDLVGGSRAESLVHRLDLLRSCRRP
jgi:hypothetical protein